MRMKDRPMNEEYASGGVEAKVRMMVRGGCLQVRGSAQMRWNYDSDKCVCGETESYFVGMHAI